MTDVTQLTEDTNPGFDSLFYSVDDPSGTPQNRKVSLQSAANAMTIEDVGAATYSLVLADRGKTKRLTSASGCAVTIPTNASVPFPIGSCIILRATGGGTIAGYTIAAAATVSLDGVATGSCAASAAIKAIVLTKVGTDEWYVDGAVGAVA